MILLTIIGKLLNNEGLEQDLKSSSWITVPYKCNRGIICGK